MLTKVVYVTLDLISTINDDQSILVSIVSTYKETPSMEWFLKDMVINYDRSFTRYIVAYNETELHESQVRHYMLLKFPLFNQGGRLT